MKADPILWRVHPQSEEIVAKRSHHAKHFRNPDGTVTALFGTWLHYEFAPGVWEDVDLTFRLDGTEHIMDRHVLNAQVGATGVAVWNRATGRGIRWLTPARPTVAGRRASVLDQGLTWYYDTRKSGIKHSAVVAVAQGPRTYTFPYQLIGSGLALATDADGHLLGDGFRVPRAYAVGADGVVYPCGPWRKVSGPRVAFDFDDTGVPLPYVLDPTSTFSVTGANDGRIRRRTFNQGYDASYSDELLDTTGTTLFAQRTAFSGSDYAISLVVHKWDTSSLADDVTINSAELRVYPTASGNTNSRNVTLDWYDFGAAIGYEDWVKDALATAHAGTSIGSFTLNQQNNIALINLENISLTGDTGLRLHISGGVPTGSNLFLYASQEDTTNPEPQLAVTYTEAAPPPAAGGHRSLRGGFKW